eukprot:1635852-Pleurochrysis_carterae.AAC.5
MGDRLQFAARSKPTDNSAGAAHRVSTTLSFTHLSHSAVRRTIMKQIRGTTMTMRVEAVAMPLVKELTSTCDACVTSVGFADSAIPSAFEPWIQ